jgi:hypothetical protein
MITTLEEFRFRRRNDRDREILEAYVERFGPLPDRRALPPDELDRLVEMCEEALKSGDPANFTVPDLPPGVTI